MDRIYLDNNASTRVDSDVLKAMVEVLENDYGNPSSVHLQGRTAKEHLLLSRQAVAQYLKVKPHEIVFTSGGTEAINLAIYGILGSDRSGAVITSDLEHAAVYQTCVRLKEEGMDIRFLSPGVRGAVLPEQLIETLTPAVRLIILTAVNTETGIKTDWERMAQIAYERGIPFVVDGVGLIGKESFSIPEGVSAMCFSGHKFHAPKGIGSLFLRRQIKIQPLLNGGGQEAGRRSGTENLPGVVGFAEAVNLLPNLLPGVTDRMARLRDRLENLLLERLPDIVIHGKGFPRICNTSNIAFTGIDGESLLMNLDLAGIAVSLGSACSSGALEPSRVLLKMGLSHKEALSSIRFSICRFTTEQEIDRCVDCVCQIVARLKALRR